MENVTIKVSKSSHLRFRNIKCNRAITFDDIYKYNNKIIILDNIESFEALEANNIITNLKSQNKIVFICDYNNNDYAQELATQAGTELATSLSGLQHSIAKRLAISVMTNWHELNELPSNKEQSHTSNSQTTRLGQATQSIQPAQINTEQAKQIKELKLLLQKVTKEKEALQKEQRKKNTRINELMDIIGSVEEQKELYKSLLDDIESFDVKYAPDLDTSKQEIEDLKNQLKQRTQQLNNTTSLIDNIKQEKNELNMQIRQLTISKTQADNKLKELQKNNTDINTKLIIYESEKESWVKQEDDYIKQIQDNLVEIKRLTTEVKNQEAQWEELNNKQSSLVELKLELDNSKASNTNYMRQLNALSIEKNKLQEHQTELENKITELNAQIQILKTRTTITGTVISPEDKEKIEKQEQQIEQLNKDLKEIKTKLDSEHNGRMINNAVFNESIKLLSIKEDVLKENESIITRLKKDVMEYEEKIEKSTDNYNTLNKRCAQLSTQIEILKENSKTEQDTLNNEISLLGEQLQKLKEEKISSKEKILEKENKIQDMELKLLELNNIEQSYTHKITQKEQEYNALKLELSDKDNTIETYRLELNNIKQELKARQDDVDTLKMTQEDLEAQLKQLKDNTKYNELLVSYKTLDVAMKKAVKELNSANHQIATMDRLNKKLEASCRQLNNSYLTLCKGNAAVPIKLEFNCEYTGRAKIIPVFGSGSYGITNIALSIAKTIKDASILIMDMDLSGGKLDTLIKKPPIIKELTDIPQQINRTSMGSLLERGYSYFKQNQSKVIQTVGTTSQRSTLDYFSGLCGKLNQNALLSVDFTSLFNDLSRNYDYIVIDLGKIGSSDIQDALIRMFNKISTKGVCVTLNDQATCRNTSIRLSIAEIDINKVIWVLNLATTTAIDDIIKRSIGKSQCIIIQQEMSVYNKNTTLNLVKTLKPRIQQLTEIVTQ